MIGLQQESIAEFNDNEQDETMSSFEKEYLS